MNHMTPNAALIIIDVQEGIDDPAHGRRNNPDAEANIARLLATWRETHRPIVHVQHLSRQPDSPLRPDRPGVEIKDVVRPREDEQVIQKHVNSAFIGTDLEEHLRARRIDTLIITGLTTDHCVSATARMAGDLGFQTYVVSDATATFDRTVPGGAVHSAEDVHGVSLASLHREFATIVDTDGVLQLISNEGEASRNGPGESLLGSQDLIDARAAHDDYLVVERDQLPDAELQGRYFGGVDVSLIFVDAAPGDGPRLHRHPYKEIFIVLEGQPMFTVGPATVEGQPGQVIIVRPHVAHKFVNSGAGRLRQIDIHLSGTFVTEWLEDDIQA